MFGSSQYTQPFSVCSAISPNNRLRQNSNSRHLVTLLFFFRVPQPRAQYQHHATSNYTVRNTSSPSCRETRASLAVPPMLRSWCPQEDLRLAEGYTGQWLCPWAFALHLARGGGCRRARASWTYCRLEKVEARIGICFCMRGIYCFASQLCCVSHRLRGEHIVVAGGISIVGRGVHEAKTRHRAAVKKPTPRGHTFRAIQTRLQFYLLSFAKY